MKGGAVAGLILARSMRRFGIDHSGLIRLGEKQNHFSDTRLGIQISLDQSLNKTDEPSIASALGLTKSS